MPQQSPPDNVAVEFRVENDRYPFVGASASESCTFELEEMIHRGGGVYSEFFRIRGADTDRILSLARETPQVQPTVLAEDGDECLFEFEVAGGCIAVSLAEGGAYPQVVRSDEGEGTVVAELPRDEARAVVRDILAEDATVEVRSEQPADGETDATDPAGSERTAADSGRGVGAATVQEEIHEVLTQRQRGVLLTALSEGFYEWPRRATLAEVAESLGTDVTALDEQLHNCEQLVLAGLFEDGTLGDVVEPAHPLSNATSTDVE